VVAQIRECARDRNHRLVVNRDRHASLVVRTRCPLMERFATAIGTDCHSPFRFIGFYFLILGGDGRLPRAFAFPAGIGDIAVALGAFALVSSKLVRLVWFVLAWNILGLADIIAVVFNALRCGLRDWQSMAALRELPLAMLPTFLVPLILASHALMLVRVIRRDVG
jgi:hypothetical protein